MGFKKSRSRFIVVEHRENGEPYFYTIDDTREQKEIGLLPQHRTDYEFAKEAIRKLNKEEK